MIESLTIPNIFAVIFTATTTPPLPPLFHIQDGDGKMVIVRTAILFVTK